MSSPSSIGGIPGPFQQLSASTLSRKILQSKHKTVNITVTSSGNLKWKTKIHMIIDMMIGKMLVPDNVRFF